MVTMALVAGVINLLVGIGVNWLVGLVLPGIALEYQNPAMFRPWTDPLMMAYFGHPFLFGFALAYLWPKLAPLLKGNPSAKALQFTGMYVILATVPGMFITYTSFQLSLGMVLLWTLTGALQVYVAASIFSRMS